MNRRLTFSILLVIAIYLLPQCNKRSYSERTWKDVSFPSTHALRDITFLNANDGIIAAGIAEELVMNNRYSLFLRTHDGGQNWWLDTCSLPNFIVYGIVYSAGALYMMGIDFEEGGQVYRSTDGGHQWSLVCATNNGVVHFFDEQHGLMTQSSKILFTDDAGKSFSTVYDDQTMGSFKSFQFLSSRIGFARGGIHIGPNHYGMVAKTTDGGKTWTKLPLQGESTSIHFPSPQVGYAFIFSNGLYKTTDGGKSWTQIYNEIVHGFYGCYFVTNTTGFAFNGDNIYITTDGGRNWSLHYHQPTTNGMAFGKFYFNPYSRKLFVIGLDGLIKRLD